MTTPADKTVCIFVNGILTLPGESDNWNGKAVTWTHLNTPFRAEKVEYLVGPISRVLGQKKRARKLIKTLRFYQGWRIILVGHSNGCDVILDALRKMDWPRIERLHLLSGACEADFDKNGLNEAGTRIGSICVYVAKRDRALRLADTITGRLLGYGALGKSGPINPALPVETVAEPKFRHSDWFKAEHFKTTMQKLTGGLA
ncbi:MAG: alpha/beta hydrolase [Thermodesulfobacteriota bacterium]